MVDAFISDLNMLFNLCYPKVNIKPTYTNCKQWIFRIYLNILLKNELYKNYLQNTIYETTHNLSIIIRNIKIY